MGNSTSHTHSQRDSALPSRTRTLKLSKRSIVDHPQLAAPSDPIPIPALPGQPPPRRPTPPPQHSDSLVADVPDLLVDNTTNTGTHTHRPIQYNSTRSFGAVRRGGVQGRPWQEDPPSQPQPMEEIVRSSIPLRIYAADDNNSNHTSFDDNGGLIPTQIVWNGGGKEVILAGTFDDLEWRARKRMRFE